jgi:excisionase family DNA binding protein
MRMSTQASRWSGPEPLLTYQQLAVWLNDSVRHIRRLVLEDRIPYHKVGHFVRFDPVEIADWLEANRWRGGSPSGPRAERRP